MNAANPNLNANAQPPLPRLALRDATVRWAATGTPALAGVTLQVHSGECVAVLGGNGAGKTTLLRALQGHQILHAGQRQVGPPPAESPGGLAMVFQQPFVLRVSALSNLRVALWLAGVRGSAGAQRAQAALQRMGLGAQARQSAPTLSGGQRQRLALARAWAIGADVLLLDEPTASLDPSAKRELEALIAQLNAEGTTVIFSTHNLGQAKRLARRVLYLEAGQLQMDCSVERFFTGTLPSGAQAFVRGEGF